MSNPMQNIASLVMVVFTAVIALVGMLIIVGSLGAYLLPIVLIVFFLLMLLATGGANMPPWLILVAIPFLFIFGYGAHLVLGAVIGFDPVQTGYATGLSAIKLSSVGGSISDSTFSEIFGIIVLAVVVLFAFAGMLMQAKRGRR